MRPASAFRPSFLALVVATLVASATPRAEDPLVIYGKYDFVPGDTIVVADDLESEPIGEFPSRWSLVRGQAEVAALEGDHVVAFGKTPTCIGLKLQPQQLAPKDFTAEFDLYFHLDGSNEAYKLKLAPGKEIYFQTHQVTYGSSSGTPGEGRVTVPGWHRVAVSVRGTALKVYFDHHRALNVPDLEAVPSKVELEALPHSATKGHPAMIRGFRLATGSKDVYEQISESGRFVARGIHFDVGKATLKPISMGVLNVVARTMRDHPELKLGVEGHTDSDGEPEANQALSEDRAKSVVQRLVALGVAEERLSAKGWGESKPAGANATAEGKANNRRVEFVKL